MIEPLICIHFYIPKYSVDLLSHFTKVRCNSLIQFFCVVLVTLGIPATGVKCAWATSTTQKNLVQESHFTFVMFKSKSTLPFAIECWQICSNIEIETLIVHAEVTKCEKIRFFKYIELQIQIQFVASILKCWYMMIYHNLLAIMLGLTE